MRPLRGILASACLIAAATLFTSLPGCETHKVVATTAAHVDMPGLQEAGLRQLWQRSIHLEPGERVKHAWRVGASVYVATSQSRLVRIDARTGTLVWNTGLGEENFEIFKPIELKDPKGGPSTLALVLTRGEAFLFDLETGDEMQPAARLGMSVSADPVVVGNTLCVGGADTFYGLYLDRLGLKHWKIPAAGDLFDSAPVALDNNVLLASRSGKLWRISADTGDWDWKDRKTNGIVAAGLAVDFNAVYVPCMDQRVYAFRSDTGGELWERQLVGRLETVPTLAGPHVLVISEGHGMYALLRTSGEQKWHADGVSHVATVEEDTVWVGDDSGYLRNLAISDGTERAKAAVPGVQIFVNNLVDNKVVLVATDGTVATYAPTEK